MPSEVDLLVVGLRWPPETFIQRKLVCLVRAGMSVTVAASVPSNQARTFALPGVRLLRLPHHDDSVLLRSVRLALLLSRSLLLSGSRKRLAALFTEINSLSAKARVNRLLSLLILSQVAPHLVHFEWNSAAIDYAHMIALWGCPFVISCRGQQINVRPYVPGNVDFVGRLRQTLESAAAVHCVSDAIKQEALNLGLDPSKAWVIRPAVDPDFFCPPASKHREDGAFHIVTTGALIWRKGYEYALLAMRRLVDSGLDVRFEIIGSGPEQQRVLYTMDDLGLKEHVHLLGQLPPERVRDHLQQADVFLLASLSEGIANAALEAMACGLPVVTTDCGGMREAVTDGVEGFVVPVRDPAAMAEALRKLALDEDLRTTMGERARERILREFTLEQQTEQFLSLYREVLEHRQT